MKKSALLSQRLKLPTRTPMTPRTHTNRPSLTSQLRDSACKESLRVFKAKKEPKTDRKEIPSKLKNTFKRKEGKFKPLKSTRGAKIGKINFDCLSKGFQNKKSMFDNRKRDTATASMRNAKKLLKKWVMDKKGKARKESELAKKEEEDRKNKTKSKNKKSELYNKITRLALGTKRDNSKGDNLMKRSRNKGTSLNRMSSREQSSRSFGTRSITKNSQIESRSNLYKNFDQEIQRKVDDGKLVFYNKNSKKSFREKSLLSKSSRNRSNGHFGNVYLMSKNKNTFFNKGRLGSKRKQKKSAKNLNLNTKQYNSMKQKPQSTRAKFGFGKKFKFSKEQKNSFINKTYRKNKKKSINDFEGTGEEFSQRTASIEPIKFSQDEKKLFHRKKRYCFKERNSSNKKDKMYLSQFKVDNEREEGFEGVDNESTNFTSAIKSSQKNKSNQFHSKNNNHSSIDDRKDKQVRSQVSRIGSNSPKPTSSVSSRLMYGSEAVSYNSHSQDTKSDFLYKDSSDSQKDFKIQKKELIKRIKKEVEEKGDIPKTTFDFFYISNLLGEGSYGKVYEGRSLLLSQPVAIKIYDKSKIKTDSSFNRILREVRISKDLSHENIVHFYEIFENKKFIALVLEYADKGDLLTRLKTEGIFTEAQFRPLLIQLLKALKYLHSRRILHRDVKLDNVLLCSDGTVKLCDFGVSRTMPPGELIYEHIGTPAYLAPEVVSKQGYGGFKADVWSLGVTALIALTGYVPFKGDTFEELAYSIQHKNFEFDESCNLSKEMQFVLKGMLMKRVDTRLTVDEVLEVLEAKVSIVEDRGVFWKEGLVKRICRYGFEEEQVRYSVETGEINHIYCLYKLLLNMEDSSGDR